VDHPAPQGAGVIALLALLASTPAATTPPAADARTSVVVVVGAPGTAEYGGRFAAWAESWKKACAQADAALAVIGLEGGGPPDRDRLMAALAREVARPAGDLWLVLLGHGTFDGRSAKFNLRGADVSADELAAWLKPARRPLVIIDAAPASAPFIKALSGPDRVVVTATRSGREQNATRLGGFLAESIADPAADLDKDGQTSLLEAFLVAAKRVDASFSEAGLLATEHALLDDNGDGLGTGASVYQGLRAGKVAGGASADGRRAHQLHLVRSDPEKAMSGELRRRRDELELQIFQLRDGRTRLTEDEYYRRMEPLLLEMAKVYQRAERR
jgi:hypothetical protein